MINLLSYLPELAAVASIHALAVMSPGPDFLVCSKNSISVSRKSGVYTALGITLGLPLHLLYSILGIGLLISKSILLFTTIKYLGALYLVYIGVKSWLAKEGKATLDASSSKTELSNFQSFKMGFLTNALNPKVTLFFLALFTQVIDHTTPKLIQALYGLEMTAVTFAWFVIVALVLSSHRVQSQYQKYQGVLNKVFGSMLIALGAKVALSGQK